MKKLEHLTDEIDINHKASFYSAGAALHAAARERGIPVHGELNFFINAIATLRAQGAKTDVMAITGTNDKTTVQPGGNL